MSRKPAAVQNIGDLIEVPPIRTVIQLVDAQKAELRDELLGTFVFTQEIQAFLGRLLPALEAPTGLGAFLKGHYGSGKSHCLTFLQRLLEGDPMACLPDGLALQERSWLVVPIPLTAYNNRTSLESIVMGNLEEGLKAATGTRPVLADRTRLLENFRRLILPHYPQPGWEELDEEAQARAALELLRSLPENPLQLSFDRRQTMARLQEHLGNRGVVLLLDELSEFLRSKGNSAGYHEDIRYLQFLGEWASQMPLWIVATLQQSLEENGHAEEESYLRIKERFPLRFTLSARHVSDLVEGRLIRRKPGSEATMEKLWTELEEAYPGLITRERFLKTYPVHPATLELLEGLMPLFSCHRGVVDFVHSRLAGNPLKGEPGILGESPDRLLTADAIFDHFEERFSEIAELAPYRDTVWAYLKSEIPRLFEELRAREMAEQAVKILILAEARQTPVARDAKGLARTMARRISRLSAQVNVDYLREKVMDVLIARSSFVARRGDEYFLDLEANVNQLLGRRFRQARPERIADWGELLALVNRSELPLAERVGLRPGTLRWENATRQGLSGWLDVAQLPYQEFVRILARLEEEPLDFAVLLGLPEPGQPETARALLEHARSSRQGPLLLFWLPAVPEPELVELALDWLGRREVARSLEEEGQREPARLARATLEQEERRLERGLAELYSSGRILWTGGEEKAPPGDPMPWAEVLGRLLKPRLAEVYPRFTSVAPFTDLLTPKGLEKLWSDFLEEGRAVRPGTADVLIETVARPLGLVQEASDHYALRVDPARFPVQAEVLDRLLPEQKLPLRQLGRALHRGPFGLLPGQFALLVAGLIQAGRATPYLNGRATRLTSIADLTRPRIDALGPAQMLEAAQLERLPELAWLWPGESLVPLNPVRLRALWDSAVLRLADLSELAGEVHALAGRTPACPALPLEELAARARRLEEMLSAVGQPVAAAVGLRRLLEQDVAELRRSALDLPAWRDVLRQHGRSIAAAWRRWERAPEVLAELEEVARDPTRWDALAEALAERDAAHRQAYAEAHKAFYAQDVFRLRGGVMARPEWAVVEALGTVLGLEARPSAATLRHVLQELPQPCHHRLDEELLFGVRCACGFEPGQAPLEVEDPLPLVRQGLASACRALAEADLDAFLRNLRQVGQESRARRLEEILSACVELAAEPSLEGTWARVAGTLAGLLDGPTVESLSRALTGHVLVAPRRLEDLVRRLQDQRLPVARLRQLFEEWLEAGALRPDSWVHVQHGADAERGLGAWVAAWLSQHGLEPGREMRRRFHLEDVGEPSGSAAEVYPLLAEALPVQALDPVAGALQERLFGPVSLSLCRLALERALADVSVARRLLELPELPWDHLEVARLAADALCVEASEGYAVVARRLPSWARARHVDLACGLLEPSLEAAITARLDECLRKCQLPGLALADVPQALAGSGPLVVLVVDALRWDLWDLMRPLVEAELGTPLAEQLALSPLPSVTHQARVALLGGEEEAPAGSDGLLLGRPVTLVKNADDKKSRARVESLLQSMPPVLMLHLAFIDRRCHESSLELWPLYQELLEEARVRLVPLLRKVRPGCRVLLLADHGFLGVEEGDRAHGGGRPQERVIPAVVWER
ncbi:hypothetical protein DYH09_01615 [bacterium CPR1]|nr:hypothetical protein [bacterium CPR1]